MMKELKEEVGEYEDQFEKGVKEYKKLENLKNSLEIQIEEI